MLLSQLSFAVTCRATAHVARVDELLTLCDALVANLDTVTATQRRLLEAALAEALAAV